MWQFIKNQLEDNKQLWLFQSVSWPFGLQMKIDSGKEIS